jgi:hypothetical protein
VLQVGQAEANRLKQPYDRDAMAVRLKESIEDGATAGLAVIQLWKDYVERTKDPPKGESTWLSQVHSNLLLTLSLQNRTRASALLPHSHRY